jgi:hypothetical protein
MQKAILVKFFLYIFLCSYQLHSQTKKVSKIATWDDYGKNYPFKEQSNEILLDTFDEHINSERKILSQTELLHNEYVGLQKVLKLVI